MSLVPARRRSTDLSRDSEIEQLNRLLKRAMDGEFALSDAQASYTVLYFLWPEIQRLDVATLPGSLKSMIGLHALAAGVTPETSHEDSKKLMEVFFERFEPNLALLRELEDLGLSFLCREREDLAAEQKRLIGDPKKSGTTLSANPKFRSSPLLIAELRDKGALQKAFR